MFQAVLRQSGPDLGLGEEGRASGRPAADAERLSRNHVTCSRPDVRPQRPHAVLLIQIRLCVHIKAPLIQQTDPLCLCVILQINNNNNNIHHLLF